MSARLRALLLIVALLSASCATKPPSEPAEPSTVPPSPPEAKSRYAQPRDGAPLKPIRAEDVRDAVPRADPLLQTGNKTPYIIDGVTYHVLENYRGYREQGVASWYGTKFDGYETSNGELYDVYQPTAAHRSLPIPSYARVTNLENGRSVVVRVNDRGPFHSDRLIDLSYAAAVKLGYMEKGTAPVEVRIIDLQGVDDRRASGDFRFLQLGAFGTKSAAQRLQAQLQSMLTVPVLVSEVARDAAVFYRVRVGPLDDRDQLRTVQRTLADNGFSQGQPVP